MNLNNPTCRLFFNSLPVGAFMVDTRRDITGWNPCAEELSGFSAGQVVGRNCGENILQSVDTSGRHLCHTDCPIARCLDEGTPGKISAYLHHADGRRIPTQVRVTPLRNEEGQLTGGMVLLQDMSEMESVRLRLQELEHLCLLDTHTRLANRRCSEQELARLFSEKQRLGLEFGIIFMDIDHFKSVNDHYGHAAGDEVLRILAGTLRNISRPYDLWARWGGEEFVALIRNVTARQLLLVADHAHTIISASRIRRTRQEIAVTVSMGATLARDADTPRELISRADALMYKAKQQGRNSIAHDLNL